MEVEEKDIKELPKDLIERWNIIDKKNMNSFGNNCSICVCAPGRVNLIGEHIDYSGYGVMPIATSLNVIIGASITDDQIIYICNTESNYADFQINVNNLRIDSDNHEWYNYVLCGIKGIFDDCKFKLMGMSLVVNGNIPPGCGLSSSSALVCAAALATTKLHSLKLEKFELAKLCAHSERLIGMEGGGMDQAASFLSKEGYATLIEFSPLRCTPVQLPKSCIFIVANSLVVKAKAIDSDYNQRVTECRLASFILAKNAGLNWENFSTLGNLQITMKINHSKMVELVEQCIHKLPYTQDDICNVLEINKMKLHQIIAPNTKHISEFYLYQRAAHVFREAERVYCFKSVCDKLDGGDHETNDQKSLMELGELMYASHASLKDFFECSHEKLDQLVKISKNIAFGARLTGAGWGGCVVAMVPKEKVDTYVNLLKNEFYNNRSETSCQLFSSFPAGGACTYISKSV